MLLDVFFLTQHIATKFLTIKVDILNLYIRLLFKNFLEESAMDVDDLKENFTEDDLSIWLKNLISNINMNIDNSKLDSKKNIEKPESVNFISIDQLTKRIV